MSENKFNIKMSLWYDSVFLCVFVFSYEYHSLFSNNLPSVIITCCDVMPYPSNRYDGTFNSISIFVFHNPLYSSVDLQHHKNMF